MFNICWLDKTNNNSAIKDIINKKRIRYIPCRLSELKKVLILKISKSVQQKITRT